MDVVRLRVRVVLGRRSLATPQARREVVDALREAIIHGNAEVHGAAANVHTRIPAAEHVRRERWLADIEKQWGPAPGRQQSDGASLFVLGERFGYVHWQFRPVRGGNAPADARRAEVLHRKRPANTY